MSFSQVLYKSIDENVNNFLRKLVNKYSLDEQEVLSFWNTTSISPQVMDALNTQMQNLNSDNTVVPMQTNINSNLPSSAELSKLSKKELENHCKLRGLKLSGTKQELIDRLTGGVDGSANANASANASSSSTKPVSKKRKTEAESVPEPIGKDVIKTIQSKIQLVKIEKNKHNNFEHSETHFVFDRSSQQVIGKQNENGSIDQLTADDIQLCNKYKFRYILPDNLNLNKKSNNVVVEELADDLEEETVEDEEEVGEDEGEAEEEPEEFNDDEDDFVEDD